MGFGLYGSIHGPCEYQVTIQIIHTGSERLLGSNEVSFTSDGSNSTFRVMFKEPIEIAPNTNYTASATLKVTLLFHQNEEFRKTENLAETLHVDHNLSTIETLTENQAIFCIIFFQGLDSYYGTKGMRKVNVECPGGQKVSFQFSYVAGNNNGTSVEDGQIPEIIFYT